MKTKKKVVYSIGGKGGSGKTTLITALAEWYSERLVPCTLLDLDSENKKKGSLCHFFPDRATKIDINTAAGLDTFVDQADKEPEVILADMGAGSGKISLSWFDSMYESVSDILTFTAIGVVTSDPASVESLLAWASQLQDRVSYLVVLNKQEDLVEDFTYWENTAEAIAFRELFNPLVMRMEARLPDLQHSLRNHGFTLGDVIHRKTTAPELGKSSLVVRAQAYRRQLFSEFDRVKSVLMP